MAQQGLVQPYTLRWRHNGRDRVSNHQLRECLLNRLFRRRSMKTSKLRVTGLCVGNSPGPVNSPHKWPVTRKMFPFDDVIMLENGLGHHCLHQCPSIVIDYTWHTYMATTLGLPFKTALSVDDSCRFSLIKHYSKWPTRCFAVFRYPDGYTAVLCCHGMPMWAVVYGHYHRQIKGRQKLKKWIGWGTKSYFCHYI